MCLPIIQGAAESLFDFAVKNAFHYVALDRVRNQLQDLITAIALPRLGGFVAPIVGNQLGLMVALPVTLAIGEAVAFTLKELIHSVYDLFLRFFAPSQRSSSASFPFLDVLLRISSFAAGFYAKTLFCNYGMTFVSNVMRVITIYGAPLCNLPPPVVLTLPLCIIIATPTVTGMVGDIIGSVVRQVVYNNLRNVSYSLLGAS